MARRDNACIDDLLDSIQLERPGDWENETGPKDWYAVSTPADGIVAYFAYGPDACRFRLDLINQIMNPTVDAHFDDGLGIEEKGE